MGSDREVPYKKKRKKYSSTRNIVVVSSYLMIATGCFKGQGHAIFGVALFYAFVRPWGSG